MKFNKDDRVFHRRLEMYGIYVDDDCFSDDSCYIKFDNEDNLDDVLCVSKNCLDKVKEK